MVPNAFPDSLYINPLCDHAGFKRFTDRECNEVICWNKVAWVLATQKQEELFVNN